MYNKLNTRQQEFLEKKMVDDKLGKPDEDGDLPSLVQDICTLRFEQKMNVDVQKGADVSLLKVALVEKDINRERGDVLPPVNTSIPVKNMTDILKEFQEKSSTEQDRTIEKLESLKAAKDYDGMQKFVIGDSTIGGSTNTRLTDHSYPVNILQIILHGEDPPKEEIGLKNTQPTFKTTATSLGKFLDTCVCAGPVGCLYLLLLSNHLAFIFLPSHRNRYVIRPGGNESKERFCACWYLSWSWPWPWSRQSTPHECYRATRHYCCCCCYKEGFC
jgi:hypothetical protein